MAGPAAYPPGTMAPMAGRRLVRFSLAVSLALVGAACHREPAPTVQAPPDPTAAPSTVLAGCVVDQGSDRPPSPRAGPSPGDYTIVQPGILVAASVTSRPPFESLQGGHPVGFDIDLIAEVSRRLGLRPEIQSATPSSVLTDVAQGRADVAISALSIRADRRSGGLHRRLLRGRPGPEDRKSTRLNSSHVKISYAVFCLKKKNK